MLLPVPVVFVQSLFPTFPLFLLIFPRRFRNSLLTFMPRQELKMGVGF